MQSGISSRSYYRDVRGPVPVSERGSRVSLTPKAATEEKRSRVVRRPSAAAAIAPARAAGTSGSLRTTTPVSATTSRNRTVVTPYRGTRASQKASTLQSPKTLSPAESTHSVPCIQRRASVPVPVSGRRSSFRNPSSVSARRSTIGPMPSRASIAMTSISGAGGASTAASSAQTPTRKRHPTAVMPIAETKEQVKSDVGRNSIPFTLSGHYSCAVVVKSSAAVWAANEETGAVDIFSSVSGDFWGRVPPRPPMKSAAGPTQGCFSLIGTLKAFEHHVWAGYDDGTVVVYDHLCVNAVTTGCFHSAPVVSFCGMSDGITVSASTDMTLVRWDKEEKNFEAITRIVGVPEAHQMLTCTTSFGDKYVLCGMTTGNIIVIDCSTGMQAATLRKHTSCVNALVVMEGLLFTSAEEGCVNVWSLRADTPSAGTTFQSCCRLLRSISVQMAVRDMVPHDASRSLWVAYVDGLVERWSANPDDDFGVEQVLREGVVDAEGVPRRVEAVALQCMGTVETMRVLALGSNGISKVWCGHRNEVEESLQQSIQSLNAIISQDAAEAALWEKKALLLKQKEMKRKQKYSLLLLSIYERQLLYSYYARWRKFSTKNTNQGRQHKEICFDLEDRHRFRILRRYFTMWCSLYEKEQRRLRQKLLSTTFQKVSRRMWLSRLFSTWRRSTTERRMARHRWQIAVALEKVSKGTLLEKFFTKWRHLRCKSRKTVGEDKINILAARARKSLQRRAYDEWRLHHSCHGNKNSPIACAPSRGNAAKIAESYEKVVIERHRRSVFNMWRNMTKRRRTLSRLTKLARSKESQRNRHILFKGFIQWQLFVQQQHLNAMSREVQLVERRLRHAEETNADIFDKLQLQKRLDQLRRQHDNETRQLQEELARAQELINERDALQSADHVVNKNGADDEEGTPVSTFGTPARSYAPQALFSPIVLQKMPTSEAMEFIMSRLKGIVLNLYTDMGLFRQVRERLRCGTTAAVIFLEGFHEVKRLIVSLSKKRVGASTRRGAERWAVTPESFDGVGALPCSGVVQGIKAMVLAYDMVSNSDMEGLAATREEIIENVDLLFALWKACYAARKPVLPVNNRVSTR
ncbi:hypothetical protein, conserved [Trypanosoma brucei gambiense DAL972]|uniref:Guanine nucleotide-binding protein subunit beta-like protein n=1 Tax=Trypanosoma brucei gambiense (strain MHOM/CI/86/DAL972) TaxID=679716 RepID=C9ZTM1_TRYB9|nr:hypothetical protein, conserved [Trypanosoma brucei gambiense DAL972]CBH12756.1 hypothetical protein, conserved [Trypanosoma brucei gambiense DAL972]|eukprot:XP_011775036.1 hypothetical protein, conserved [Trypanosoma brucei gambiense DAL972]